MPSTAKAAESADYQPKTAEAGAKSDNRWQVGDGSLFRHK